MKAGRSGVDQSGPPRSGMSCCWLQGVRITGLNGLERPHIGTQCFQIWEFEESKGTLREGCFLKQIILLIRRRAWEI